MKWEAVKRKVADAVYTGIKHNWLNYEASAATLLDAISERRTVQESADDLADQCHKIIMNWDVRMAPKLRDLFPEHFPPSLRGGKLAAYMEDSEDSPWILYRMGPTNC